MLSHSGMLQDIKNCPLLASFHVLCTVQTDFVSFSNYSAKDVVRRTEPSNIVNIVYSCEGPKIAQALWHYVVLGGIRKQGFDS